MSENHMETAQRQTESWSGLRVGQSDEIPPLEVTRAYGHLKNNNCFVRRVWTGGKISYTATPLCRVHTLLDPLLLSEMHKSFSFSFDLVL